MTVCPGEDTHGAAMYQERVRCLFEVTRGLTSYGRGATYAAWGGTVSDKPHEKRSRRQLLPAAGAAGVDRVALPIGGALAAAATASAPEEMDVDRMLDRKHPRVLFSGRAVMLTGLAEEMPRDLAAWASKPAGRGDAMLHTRAEYGALFNAVTAGAGTRKGSR